jgi:hypothetical protein
VRITYDTVGHVRYINPEWRDSPEAPRIGTRESRHANTSYREIIVRDARAADELFDLDIAGFELVTQDTTTACRDEERIRSHYRGEMLDLVRDVTGATQTHMLGHLVRTEDQSDFNYAYSRFVHCDFNIANLQTMSLELLKRRHVDADPGWTYAWYNTWQPVDNQVHQNALAVLDVRSLAEGDLIDYRYTGYQPGGGDGGLVTAPIYNPDHRWYYYPSMTTSEVLLTKQLDPRAGRACQSPHTSFLDGSVPEDVPPRRSIETRVLAVFE